MKNKAADGLDVLLPSVLRYQTKQKIGGKKRKHYFHKCFPTLLAGFPTQPGQVPTLLTEISYYTNITSK